MRVPESNQDRWPAGSEVVVRGRQWTVVSESRFEDCRALRVTSAQGSDSACVRTLLLPFDRPRHVDSDSIRVVRPRRWVRLLQRAAVDARPFGGLFPAAAGAIDLHSYQLEPALAVAREGVTRLLIADAVGLGKTIQAGLIVRQLASERESFRALVVVPASLRDQWATELKSRFDVPAQVVTVTWLTRTSRELPTDVSPWALPGVYIASFEFIRQPEILRPLEDMGWDLLVVDEAHAATVGTARRAAVHAVALRARRVVLLTATPHTGDDEHFRALCDIGRLDSQPDPIVLFRRSRGDVGIAERRRTRLLPVTLSETERRTHRLLERYTSNLSAESRLSGNAQARLLAVVLRKRALSSVASLAVSCKRRLALLATRATAETTDQLSLPLEDDEMLPEDDEPVGILSVPGLANVSRERLHLESIVAAAETAAISESKIVRLTRLLARIKEPAIVFTEYRDTLARLYAHLRVAHPDVSTLHGGMPTSERSLVQQEFNAKGTLLLATDAASEGLNLQHRCRTVIHFELPWSPSRLEQRTGRVDRIGQKRMVHEIMLIASDTAERLVLAPLVRRAARAGQFMSSGTQLLESVTESRVAAAILDGTPLACGIPAVDDQTTRPPVDLSRAALTETQRLSELRDWSPRTSCGPAVRGIPAAAITPTRVRLRQGVVRLYILTLTAGDGAIVHSDLVAVHERRTVGHAKTSPDVRKLLAVINGKDFNADDPLLEALSERINVVRESCGRVAAALSKRESVVSAPAASSAQQLVQRGLFDRRWERATYSRARVSAAILEEASRRMTSLDAWSHLTASLKLHSILLVVGGTDGP